MNESEPIDFAFFDDKPKSKSTYSSDDNKISNSTSNVIEKSASVYEKRFSSSSSDTSSSNTHPSDLHGMQEVQSNSEDISNIESMSKSSHSHSSSNLANENQVDVESDSNLSSSSYSSTTQLSVTLTSKSHSDESNSDEDVLSLSSNQSDSKKSSLKASENIISKEQKSIELKTSLHSDSSESMTDVSPLTSPEKSPDLNKKNGNNENHTKLVPYQHITKLNVVFKNDKNCSAADKKGSLSTSGQRVYNAVEWSSDSEEDEDLNNSINFEQYHDMDQEENDTHLIRHRNAVLNHRQRLLDSAARGSMDISNLLETVLKFEKQNSVRKARNRMEMPVNHGFGENVISVPERRRRKNMSFTNEQVRDIDRENKRLLKKISSQSRPSSASSIRSNASSRASNYSRQSRSSRVGSSASRIESEKPVRLYHSAVNRLQFQRRIERENMQLLKRLQLAKPTPGLQRKRQLDHYKQQSDYMGTTINRNGMSVQKANKLTRNAEVVQRAIGISKKNKHARPIWKDTW